MKNKIKFNDNLCIIVSALILMVLASGCFEPAPPGDNYTDNHKVNGQNGAGGDDNDSPGKVNIAVNEGDFVLMEMTIRLKNGTILNTTDEKKARQAGIYDGSKSYEPVRYEVGADEIKDIDEAVVGMFIGGEKTFIIPLPETKRVFINEPHSVLAKRNFIGSRQEQYPTGEFLMKILESYPGASDEVYEKFKEGEILNITGFQWPIKILKITDENVTIEHEPSVGDEIQTPFGINATIKEITDDLIIMVMNLEEISAGTIVETIDGEGMILDKGEDYVKLYPIVPEDYLVVYVKILDIERY